MPQRNGRGPQGNGSGTGRGLGRCRSHNIATANNINTDELSLSNCKGKGHKNGGKKSKHGKCCGHKHHEA